MFHSFWSESVRQCHQLLMVPKHSAVVTLFTFKWAQQSFPAEWWFISCSPNLINLCFRELLYTEKLEELTTANHSYAERAGQRLPLVHTYMQTHVWEAIWWSSCQPSTVRQDTSICQDTFQTLVQKQRESMKTKWVLSERRAPATAGHKYETKHSYTTNTSVLWARGNGEGGLATGDQTGLILEGFSLNPNGARTWLL